MTAKTADFSGTIFYNPAGPGFNPVASATIHVPSSVDEGDPATISLVTWAIPDGTLYWRIASQQNLPNNRFAATNGSFNLVHNRGSFTVTVSADNTTNTGLVQEYAVIVSKTINGPNIYDAPLGLPGITVNDTSRTRVQLTSGTSLAFNGTNNQNVQVRGTLSDWAMGDNWCIEWWEKMPDAGNDDYRGVIGQMVTSNDGLDIWHNSGNICINNAQITFAQPSPGEWHHIAVQKYGGVVKAYIDGVLQTLITNTTGASTFTNMSNGLIIGNRTFDGTNAIGQTFKGELANIRISSGVPEPRYSGTFTPPTTVTVDGFTRLALSGQVGGNGMLDDVSASNHNIDNYGAVVIPSISPVQEFVFQNAGGSNYSIDGIGFPTLTLIRGGTYIFDLSQITASYPWALRLSNGDTSVVPGTTGGIGNGGSGNDTINGVFGTSPAGTVPSKIVYQVPLDAPSSIVYQCVYVSLMIGTINIEY
jgi:hypothetical protein